MADGGHGMHTRTTDHFDLHDLESKLEYEFRDRELLKQALRHGTWVNQNGEGPSYQRLEFLGDAVLQLVATDFMFDQYPNHDEGGLWENRKPVIKDDACRVVAEQIGLERHIMLGKGQEATGGILSDAMEAVLGAVYKDSDLEHSRRLILRLWKLPGLVRS